jgi:hypothetical protein
MLIVEFAEPHASLNDQQDKLDQALLQRPKREELVREGILG